MSTLQMSTPDRKDYIVSHLKNSFFSSSVFKVRLFRKFITSRKSFLCIEKLCLKTSHLYHVPISAKANNTNLKNSWVNRELSGGREKGSEFRRPACRVFFRLSDSSCDTGHNTGNRRMNKFKIMHRGCKHYKAITLLTIAIQERDEGLHHDSKRVTVPRVSIFLRKHFKALNLSTTCFMRTSEQMGKFFHFSDATFNLLTSSSGGTQVASLKLSMLVRNWGVEGGDNWKSKHKTDPDSSNVGFLKK